jgi:hypothetical protein
MAGVLAITEGNGFTIVDDTTGFIFATQELDPRTGTSFISAEEATTYATENYAAFLPQPPAE